MSNSRQFNFDLYVEELLAEALSPAQMQDRIKEVGLDPTKYDQNHLLFLVGLINSNQGIEVYDELLSKIKDKGLLKSILSVSINDRRSDNPTLDMDKIQRAIQYANDPAELRAILQGQKREIVKTEEPQYDSSKLKQFLSKNNAEDLLEILIKIRPEINNVLETFVTEYNQADEEVKRYVKTNAHRATDVLKLAAILHEARSKSLNPFNASTTLTVDDLRKESDFYNLEKNFYIVRTTYPDNPSKSLKLNLKFGQGNRFGLCISSKTENYYLSYRTDDYLTTYFVYRLADSSLDKNNINNYNIAIIDSIADPNANDYSDIVSYNPVATLTNLDPVEFEYDNIDTKLGMLTHLYTRLDHIFQEDSLNLTSRDNKNYVLNAYTFFKIFTPLEISPHEQRLSTMVNLNQDEFIDEFLAVNTKDQIVVLINGGLDKIDEYLFNEFSPEVRDFFVKNSNTIKDFKIYNQYTEKEKQSYKTRKINQINKKYESYKDEAFLTFFTADFADDYKNLYQEIYPSSKTLEGIKSNIDLNIILENPEYRKTFIEPQMKLADIIRQEILDDVRMNGVYEGNLDLRYRKSTDVVGREKVRKRDLILYLTLPDLSDIIIDGSFDITNMKLTSLKGCPKVITKNFLCNSNNLTSLEGGPEIVGLAYAANHNSLQTLKGCASLIGTQLNLDYNKQLKSLEGCPEFVFGFSANTCSLESLKGGPKIAKTYNVKNNNLKTIEHAPIYMVEGFEFSGNPIESIEGFPKYFSGHSDLYGLSMESRIKIKLELGIPKDNLAYTLTDYLILRLLNHIDFNPSDREKSIAYKGKVWDDFKKFYTENTEQINTKIEELKSINLDKKEKVTKESVIYNLLKSYLLRS